jgi:Kinesin motor domain
LTSKVSHLISHSSMDPMEEGLSCLPVPMLACLLHQALLVVVKLKHTHSVSLYHMHEDVDGCFNTWDTNQEVYERSSVRNIVLSSLEGINGTVFMYGQTGAGKTYTMLGNGMISGVKTRQTPNFDQNEISPRTARLYGG